jgi:hypothetical protein
MRRKLVNALLTVTGFTCLIVASGMASSALTSSPRPAITATSDLRAVLTDEGAVQRPAMTPANVTNINFDQAFSDATAIRNRNDTPLVREKFRNVGWTRIIAAR